MKYAILTQDGLPRGYFDPAVHTDIPAGAIALTEDQWAEFVSHPGLRRWDGAQIVAYEPPPIDLDALRASLCAGIDIAAEAQRARYITPGSGQAMTYQAKALEAERLAADPAPDADAYPLLTAEVGVTAETLAEVGAVVRAAHAQWQIMGGAIERARLAGKAAVMAADDEAGARAAAEVEWPPALT